MTTKAALRKQSRSRRCAVSAEQREDASRLLKDNFLSLNRVHQATKIAMYLVNDGEISTEQIMHWCWQNNKQVYVPIVGRVGDAKLVFAPITAETQFKKNRFQIDEPIVAAEQCISAEMLDLVLTPLVAFDDAGNRLGMGGGFYDTTFAFVRDSLDRANMLIGVAYQFQCIEQIGTESWDIPLNTVITEQRVYHF